MCDTLYAAPEGIKRKSAFLFAKNSDRPPNEAQYLAWSPAQKNGQGEMLKCTYLEIPQVEYNVCNLP